MIFLLEALKWLCLPPRIKSKFLTVREDPTRFASLSSLNLPFCPYGLSSFGQTSLVSALGLGVFVLPSGLNTLPPDLPGLIPPPHHSGLKCHLLQKVFQGFPGGAVVKNLPANAGDTDSSPGPGRSHMPQSNEARAPQLLSLCSRACEPQLLSTCATATEARVPIARAPQQEKLPQ